MFCEEKSTWKEKIQAAILLIVMLGSIFGIMTTVVTASSKDSFKSAWEKKNYTTEEVKSLYETYTDESEFEELDIFLTSELFRYLESESGSKISEMSDYDKVVLTSLWITDYMEYDYTNTHKYTYDVLKFKNGDCVGYADLFYTCMNKLGVQCEIVTMNANVEPEDFKDFSLKQAFNIMGLGHAINLVTIKGGNYLVDCCWYDASQNADYILFGQNIFIQKYMYTDMGDMDYVDGYKLSKDVFDSLELSALTN